MREAEFKHQINRLKLVYGDKAYPDERVKLLWRECAGYDGTWFERTVDDFIGSEKFAPMLDQFRMKSSVEREKARHRERTQSERDAKEFFSGSIFQDDDKRFFAQTIWKRMNGEIPDDQWAKFMASLDEKEIDKVVKRLPGECRYCDSSGLRLTGDGVPTVRACFCRQGDQFARVYGRAS